jgi:ABC-type sugar transport system permease subunit
MATVNTRKLARAMLAPSVAILFVWMIVPLVLTLWYSFQTYNPLNPINGLRRSFELHPSSPIRPSSKPSATR